MVAQDRTEPRPDGARPSIQRRIDGRLRILQRGDRIGSREKIVDAGNWSAVRQGRAAGLCIKQTLNSMVRSIVAIGPKMRAVLRVAQEEVELVSVRIRRAVYIELRREDSPSRVFLGLKPIRQRSDRRFRHPRLRKRCIPSEGRSDRRQDEKSDRGDDR